MLLVTAAACDHPAPTQSIRLVDPEHRARMTADFGNGPAPLPAAPEARPSPAPSITAATSDYPRAEIDDETRLVLAAPAHEVLIYAPWFEIAASGAYRDTVGAGDLLAGAARLWLQPQVQVGSEWLRLPGRIVDVDRQDGKPRVTVDLRFPEELAGRTVALVVEATAVDWGPRISLRSAPLLIPRKAELELATGVFEPAWNQGPVRFVVEACADSVCEPLYETRMDPAQASERGWRDAAVSLDRYAGRTVALVFRSELSPTTAEELSLPAWANPTIRVPRRADRSAPNVVMLSIDTLSAKHLPTYGYFRDTAPVLTETFARGGTVFTDCVAAATATPQAHMSMFTGLQPLEHGITTGLLVLDPAILTVTEHIRAAGIATGAITEDGWLGATFGFGRGFDEYKENKSADIMTAIGQVDATFAAAKAWLGRHTDQRFFLFLHTFQVHYPYAPPARYANLFPADADGAAIDADAPAAVRAARSYDQEIRYVDDELGALLAAMDALGLADNTVFIVTSDHGEAFLEHGFLQHGSFLFEEVTHVPLLLRGPGIPHGLRVTAPVGHVDLANTLASFFAVEPPRGSRGVDLRRTFAEGNSAVDGAFYFTESWGSMAEGPDGTLLPFFAPAFAVRQGQRKTARYPDGGGSQRSECYDLAADPDERTNLCATAIPEPADLAAALDAYRDVAARRRAGIIPADETAAEAPRQAPFDPEREDKLRALGYLQ
ncbi:MAG: sulfatase [Myxococcales bacterium]|nr:sulfatase [Myxococcales bacterium]